MGNFDLTRKQPEGVALEAGVRPSGVRKRPDAVEGEVGAFTQYPPVCPVWVDGGSRGE
jgi:hypothetical protein